MKFVIIGMGQFGRALALYLTDSGFEVTILDEKESVVKELENRVADALTGDATDSRVLNNLDLVGDDIYVVVAVGEGFERGILIAAQLQEMGVKHLYVRIVNELHGKVLKLIGITDLFRVEDVAARQLASRFLHEGFMRQRKIDSAHSLADVRLPEAWVGKTLLEVDLRKKYRLNLLTVRRGAAREPSPDDDVLAQPEQPVIDSPEPTMSFQKGDVLVLFGKDTDLQRFAEHFGL